LESTPADLDVAALVSAISSTEGVTAVHDLHCWSLSSDVRALSAHIVLDGHPSLEEAQVVGERVKTVVGRRFDVAHATFEMECEPCADDVTEACAVDPVLHNIE
jgi:cobalt-zinc-cadmium efflux system protein